jgi:hypothetical protein
VISVYLGCSNRHRNTYTLLRPSTKSDHRDPCAASVYQYSVEAGATAFRSRFFHLEYKLGFVFVYTNETIDSDVDNSIQFENSSRRCGSVWRYRTGQTNRLYTRRSIRRVSVCQGLGEGCSRSPNEYR